MIACAQVFDLRRSQKRFFLSLHRSTQCPRTVSSAWNC